MKNSYLFLLILLTLLFSCRDEPEDRREIFNADYRIDTITLTSSRQGKTQWKFTGSDVLIEDKIITGKDVDIEFYTGKSQSKITGDRGEMEMEKEMTLEGNVEFRDAAHIILCHKLDYDMDKEKIIIPDTFVLKVKDKEHIMRGYKLTSDADFIKIHIGRVIDMKYLLEEPIGDFFEEK